MSESTEHDNMPMEDFEAMLEESITPPSRGKRVTGTVAQINDNDIMINFGFKTEGIAPRADFEEDGKLTVEVGDEVEVMVTKVMGGGAHIRLSKQVLEQEADWVGIEEKFENNVPVEVTIEKKVDKGFTGKTESIDCYIPDTHIDFKNQVKEPEFYIGSTFPCKILKVNARNKSILVSRKLYMIERQEVERKEFFEKVQTGEVLNGTVKTLKNYGAFLNFGPVDGFLHKNNISWGRAKHPSKYLAEDDKVEVVVLGVDRENEKLEVGLKQRSEDPWKTVDENYPIGGTASGVVVTRRNNGYIVEIEPGVDGFIPLDEVSWLKTTKARLEPKDTIEGKILGKDDKSKKLTLSVKALTDNPWNTLMKDYPEGTLVKGTLKSITEFGLFVDFGEFIDGLVRKSDISWTEDVDNIEEQFTEGQEIEAKILKLDPQRERISLGIKQLTPNPFKEVQKQLPQGKILDLKISALSREGATVELPGVDLPGFIPTAEMTVERLDNPETKFKVGDDITASVMRIDMRTKQVLLSVRRQQQDSEKREMKEYLKSMQSDDEGTFSLGSILKEKLNK